MRKIAAMLVCGVLTVAWVGGLEAQQRAALPAAPPLKVNPNIIAKILPQPRMTSFDPARDGFKFSNEFHNNFISEFDIATDGLCGGMVYSALDYWKSHRRIPQQAWLPTEGSRLQSWIYNRQVNSIVSNLDKWAELFLNPGGARNDEFFRWGLEGKPGGRIDELKRFIDRGQPVPLGLRGCDEGCSGDHQVLAIGYSMGRYKGDLGAYKTDFKIFVYDPNKPGVRRTLRVDPSQHKFYYEEKPNKKWRTYMVDANWHLKIPPDIATLSRELLVTLQTGEDDMRGGNDNLDIFLERGSQPELAFRNVNMGKRWISHSTQTVPVILPSGTSYGQITGIRLVHTGRNPQRSWDNWDLRRISVTTGDAARKRLLFRTSGSPAYRFTYQNRAKLWNFAAASSANQLVATLGTGEDDLRGGNDNVNLYLLLRDGRVKRYANINKGRKWENGAVITLRLPLPAGITYRQIGGVKLQITSYGGVGGDNWDLHSLDLSTSEAGASHKLFYKDDSPLFRFTAHKSSHEWRF